MKYGYELLPAWFGGVSSAFHPLINGLPHGAGGQSQ